jgi:hypothetical protein
MMPFPLIQETMFFPSKENEFKLATILKKAIKTIDIAIFAFTNHVLKNSLLFAHKNGVKIRYYVIYRIESSPMMNVPNFKDLIYMN